MPIAPTTSVNGYYVDISWTAPYNGGATITEYIVKIRLFDGVTFQ